MCHTFYCRSYKCVSATSRDKTNKKKRIMLDSCNEFLSSLKKKLNYSKDSPGKWVFEVQTTNRKTRRFHATYVTIQKEEIDSIRGEIAYIPFINL